LERLFQNHRLLAAELIRCYFDPEYNQYVFTFAKDQTAVLLSVIDEFVA
jgi:hypothetical protein